MQEMVEFPLLADPGTYRASTFDYLRPAEGQPSAQEWCNVFRKSLPEFQRLASQDPAVPEEGRQVRRPVERVVLQPAHVDPTCLTRS